jgi:hypothetical protein
MSSDNSEYTPTTEQVRTVYAESRDRDYYSPSIEKARQYRESGGGQGEFDRWLAEHDAELERQIQGWVRSATEAKDAHRAEVEALRTRLAETEAVIAKAREWNTLTNGRPRYRECDDIVSGATCWWANIDGGGSWFPHDFYDGECVNCFRREENLAAPSDVLAEREREAVARAWDEGWDEGNDPHNGSRNPYRSGSEGKDHG